MTDSVGSSLLAYLWQDAVADGMSEAESRPILDSIMQHATLPEFCCRISWSAGMVAVWDNFSTQHYAVTDYFGFRREMRRASFSGYSIQDYISSGPQDAY